MPDDAFVQEIEQEIHEVNKIKNETRSYMTLALMIMEECKEGVAFSGQQVDVKSTLDVRPQNFTMR